ncbi:hypothetical protein GCM10010960_14360 [Arenimonas maotaiensis]|uniref:Secreted protein n=1 Tax=Arenimonas maotaiensis TaxID=1446479 RepID=A0A917CQ35_9GAMM|nr:hypothetical protein [Arenimonas maotaiensis]GGF93708.1 hypothetical protein GCM10010960_14360 [Arenimonas maotaiensis]
MTRRLVFLALCFVAGLAPATAVTAKESNSGITIRTEQYPRPPYSEAKYFIYEKAGTTVCAKLQVCNKYDECQSSYRRGSYKAATGRKTGEPYGTSLAVPIAPSELGKHVCLVRYKLVGTR